VVVVEGYLEIYVEDSGVIFYSFDVTSHPIKGVGNA